MKQNVTEKLNEALNVDASSQEVVVKEDVIFEHPENAPDAEISRLQNGKKI